MTEQTELHKEAPPSYDDATAGKDAPPSYEQLFGVKQMKNDIMEARENSSNRGVFAVKFCDIVCGSVACMFCLIILAALPVAMIVIGGVYLHSCPGRPQIPVWLIVFGVFSLIQTLINVIKRFFKKCRKENDDEEGGSSDFGKRGGSCLETLISIFLFVWTIVGSYWVYGYYGVYDFCVDNGFATTNPGCCHPAPYLFSFVTLTVIYVFSFLMVFGCCCCFICLAFIAGVSSE